MAYKVKLSKSITFVVMLLIAVSCTDADKRVSITATALVESSTNATTQSFSPLQELSTCTNPNCWIGIVPGSTTLIEAQLILKTRYGEENVETDLHSINWNTASSDGYSGGSLITNDPGIVSEVDVLFPEEAVTVAELIDHIGEPSFVYVASAFSSASQCPALLITFPNIGVNTWLYPPSMSAGISPSQSIQRLVILPLELARDWTITDHVILEWQGFEDYCELINNADSEG